jgi:hypothetical protein
MDTAPAVKNIAQPWAPARSRIEQQHSTSWIPDMPEKTLTERIRSFWDFLILFSGISTASNLSRTRKEPVLNRGLFLFRSKRGK